MGRESPPVGMTENDLREFADALREVAASIDAATDKMREAKVEKIWPKHWQSAKNAIPDITKFASFVYHESINVQFDKVFSNEPQKPSSVKKKSPAKAKKNQSSE